MIKRRIFAIVMAICMLVCLLSFTSCGNENWGFGNYDWQHIHFSDFTLNGGHCATISSWHDNSTGIEVHTKEYGSMFLSEGSYILFETDTCPYCNGGD